MLKKLSLLGASLVFSLSLSAQFLMDMMDTSTTTGMGMLSIYKKFDRLRFTGYIQPQFQVAGSKGVDAFEGGDFGPRVSNRFMLRRSRVRIDYAHFEPKNKPGVQFVFQFDANERGFTVRDVWGRIFENNLKLFSFTTGMFARPFGFETNYSSSDRESPERGRMNQVLMRSERDLGAMLSFDVRKEKHPLKYLKIDVGAFNGQGITANGDFDNTKDFIGRISLKPYRITKSLQLSAGTSVLLGGLENNTNFHLSTATENNMKVVRVDSAPANNGKISPRRYYGADAQLKIRNRKGLTTELRAEFIMGTQTSTLNSSETPTALLANTNEGYYERDFNGAYFYLLQQFINPQHQLLLKYDWYDPDTKIAGKEIGTPNSNFTSASVKHRTLGMGYLFYASDNIKFTLYYARVWNERTLLTGYQDDIKDDVLTCRVQFRF